MGWKIGPEVVYLAEGNAADTGKAIKWAQELGKQAVYNSYDFKVMLNSVMMSTVLKDVA